MSKSVGGQTLASKDQIVSMKAQLYAYKIIKYQEDDQSTR